jgi:hypothetical protein
MAEPRPNQTPLPETEAESRIRDTIGPNGIENDDAQAPEGQGETAETPEATPSPEAQEQNEADQEARRALREEVAEIADRIRKSDERSREAAALADYVAEFGQEGLEGYFDEKRDDGLFESATPEQLTQDIAAIERVLNLEGELALVDKVKAALPGVEQAKIDQAISAVREALYGMILEGHLSGEKLAGVIGKIVVSEKPGAEYKDHPNPDNVFAYFQKSGDGQTILFLYGNFFTRPRSLEQQARFIRHEAGHLLASGIFGANYSLFKKYAEFPTPENIADMESKSPELAELLRVLQKPEEHMAIWSPYIQKRIQELKQNETGDAKARLGTELVAEMISYYLEQGSSSETYLARRLEVTDPAQVVKYLASRAGTDVESFYDKYKIAPEMGIKKIIAHLSRYEEFAPLFRANGSWFRKLDAAFANRGESLSGDQQTADFEDYGWDDEGPSQPMYSNWNENQTGQLSADEPAQSRAPVNNVLAVLTGRSDIFGGGATGPADVLKAA